MWVEGDAVVVVVRDEAEHDEEEMLLIEPGIIVSISSCVLSFWI